MPPVSVQTVATTDARLLASPILQEYDASTMDELAMIPASVQPVEIVTARLLARPILQEYDASTVGLAVHPGNQIENLTGS